MTAVPAWPWVTTTDGWFSAACAAFVVWQYYHRDPVRLRTYSRREPSVWFEEVS